LASGAEIEKLLERIADLDARFCGEDVGERALLVEEVARHCRQSPETALPYLPGLQQLLDRTMGFRGRAMEERLELSRSMSTLETHLRQLRSFGEPAAADATLLNRLA
jgi:hypothetical protein